MPAHFRRGQTLDGAEPVRDHGHGTFGRRPLLRDGRELFYLNGSKMFVVDVTTSPNFAVSVPRMLLEGDFELLSRGDTNYDVAPDGQRFLMVQLRVGLQDRAHA